MHVLPLTEEESHSEQRFWMNERNPLFLDSERAVQRGVPRFEISFGIDANKMLTITAKDLFSSQMILSNYPVIRLI